MPIKTVLFYIFAAVVIGSAVVVTFHKSIMHCAFALLFTLFGVAALFAMMNADFLAVTQVIVYIGGVLVLFLFATFLTSGMSEIKVTNQTMRPFAGLLSGLALLLILLYTIFNTDFREVPVMGTNSTVKPIGDALLSVYLFPFEIISILLLAVLVGAVMIARREVSPEERDR